MFLDQKCHLFHFSLLPGCKMNSMNSPLCLASFGKGNTLTCFVDRSRSPGSWINKRKSKNNKTKPKIQQPGPQEETFLEEESPTLCL